MPQTYTPIVSTTLTSANTFTFSNIPQTYTDLVLVGSFGMATAGDIVYVQVGNGSVDTGLGYSYTELFGNGTSASSARTTTRNTGIAAYSNTSNAINTSINHFMNYSNTTTNKTWLCRGNESTTGTAAWVNLWRSTSAINTIKFYTATGGNFTNGSTFTLYGVKSA